MAGSYQLMENLCAATGIERKRDKEGMQTPVSARADGNFSIEFVECLASCGTAPVCMINDELHENIDPNSAADLLSNPRSGFGGAQPFPHLLERRLIFKDIDTYLREGGYEQLKKALTMSRADIVNEVKTSGLRGRGGAGFP